MKTSFVIMGLPASGKTTFLAALWHLVESGETECRLKLDRYDGDLTYLNRIAQSWRTFEKVPRTSQVGDVNVTIHLLDRATGEKGAAFFPDLAGETFDQQVEGRRCRTEFVEQVSVDDGILFFINADVKDDFLSVTELNAKLPGGGAEPEAEPAEKSAEDLLGGEVAEKATVSMHEWEPKLLPVQVRVVQLLSDFLRPPFTLRRRRLAVMISAWDLIRDSGISPDQWLAAKMPLVDQFLKSNEASFKHHIYGVSAQGVRLNDREAVGQAAKLESSRRIQIVSAESEGHDLTVPLVWLMSADE
ncbi:TRAFAC clade GTPase domain-containing protein [Pseudomonas lini]